MKNRTKEIITCENRLIRTISKEVKNIDKEVKEISIFMHNTLKKYPGIGLAAIQIGVAKRIILIDLTPYAKENDIIKPLNVILINPVIKSTSEREEIDTEGCLSVPEIREKVKRKFWVEVEGFTLEGKKFHKKLYDLAGRVAQHEIDHLNGILFIDKIEKEK